MSKQKKIIKLCTISADIGGETCIKDRGQFITEEQIATFIEKYTTGEYDDRFNIYPLNYRGMQQMEKHGRCHNSGCDKYYVSFEMLSVFSFEKFESGKFPLKFYSNDNMEEIK